MRDLFRFAINGSREPIKTIEMFTYCFACLRAVCSLCGDEIVFPENKPL